MSASRLGLGFKDNLIGPWGDGPSIGVQECFPNPLWIVSGLAIDGTNGSITVTYTTKVAAATANTVILVPNAGGAVLASGTIPGGPITWNCTTGTLVAKYRPAECR